MAENIILVGAVSEGRYQEIVDEALKLVRDQRRIQFRLGDLALELEPMRERGGNHRADNGFDTVAEALAKMAEDIDVPVATLESYRWVSSRWPRHLREVKASWWVYKILASAPDRFITISQPPPNLATGRAGWSADTALREVGREPSIARTQVEKVNKVQDLLQDDETASRIVHQLLARPEVAYRAMSDPVTRHAVNRAQLTRSEQSRQIAREELPSVARIEHHSAFYDLAGACQIYIASVSKAVPTLSAGQLDEEEKQTLQADLRRVRAAADALERCINDQSESFDVAMAKILAGEKS